MTQGPKLITEKKKSTKSNEKKLTPKQERFCVLVANGTNQTDAYRQVYKAGGKAETVYRSAKTLMDNPKIKARIAAIIAPAIEEVQLTAENVLRDLKLVREDAMKFRDGDMIDRRAALKALELEGKYLKLFTDKMEIGGKDGGPIVIQVSRSV